MKTFSVADSKSHSYLPDFCSARCPVLHLNWHSQSVVCSRGSGRKSTRVGSTSVLGHIMLGHDPRNDLFLRWPCGSLRGYGFGRFVALALDAETAAAGTDW